MSDTDTIWLHRGSTGDWTITVTNADGTVRDLTGATNLQFIIKQKTRDGDSQALVSVTPTLSDAANGVVSVVVAPAATVAVPPGTYYWGFQFKESDGRLWELPPPQEDNGRIKLVGDIVRATP